MKNTITSFLTAALAVLLLTQCSKDETMYNAHFWTSNDTSQVRLSLYIDNVYKGELPYLTSAPGCSSEGPLSFPMESGKHDIVAKDAQGNIRSSGTVKMKRTAQRSSMSSSGTLGGQDLYSNNDCLIVKVYY